MELKPIIPNPGSEFNPDNFVGRQDVTEAANRMLAVGQRIILNDPRRMGKTFWIKTFAARQGQAKKYRVVFIDYQGANSLDEFLTYTVRALAAYQRLPKRFLKRLKGWFDNVELGASGAITIKKSIQRASKSSLELLEELLRQLDNDVKEDDGGPLVIAMDEVADAVLEIAKRQTPEEAHTLLKRLRHLRNETKHLRWIVSGSVGFHHVLSVCGATEDVNNDLDPLKFGPLNATDSAELARRLALGIDRPIGDEAVQTAVRLTNGIPSLLQSLFDLLQFDSEGQASAGTEISVAEVKERLNDFIEDRDQSRHVLHYVSRIGTYYGDNAALAHRILAWAATTPTWHSVADLAATLKKQLGKAFDHERFQSTLLNLVDDHYLLMRFLDGERDVMWRYDILRVIYLRHKVQD
ncbi:MAG: hypothetical protein LBN10_08165 [Propionibacteriaceae bacterium]|jgi:hypothetical protein|nr:hypothetical protein [Propionibacteriaceae bacterium]